MKLSLGLMLAICLAGLQLIAILMVVMSSYFTSERVLLDHARSLLSDVATNTIEHSKGFLKPATGAAELATRLAENEIVASDNPALLEKLLFQQLQIAPQFAGVFYGDINGNFVYVMKTDGPGPFRSKMIDRDGDNRRTDLIWRNAKFEIMETRLDESDTYDPRQRPWFQKAQAEEKLIWTDPYIFFSAKTPGITVASPVFADDGTVTGVIGVDIEIDAISEFLSNLKVGEYGKALILNRNGDVIAHPNPDLIKTENADGTLRFLGIDEIADPIARTAFGGLKQDGEISVKNEVSSLFAYENANYVSTLKPILNSPLPWTIAIYAPENDFIGVIKQNRAQNIAIAVAVAALTGFIGLLLAKHIHTPIRALAERATQISRGNYDADAPFPRTFSELESANETMTQEIDRRQKAEFEYGRTFDLASRGMSQIHPETGQFLRVNRKLSDMSGYDVNALLGMSIKDISHPDDRDDFFVTPTEGLGGTEHLREKRILHKDGSEVWVMVNAIPIQDDTGSTLHTVVTLDDITEAKEAEAQIRHLNHDINHNARMNTMGEMAAGIAHEINQPLTAITQNADAALLTAKAQSKPDPELVTILSELEAQAHRAGDIIHALRGFVRKGDPSKSSIDLQELIKQTVSLVGAEAKEHGVEIEVVSQPSTYISGTRVQIAQVLVNLLRNAIESISMTKGNNRRLVKVWTTEIDDGTIKLSVQDTGLGIEEGFDPFAQFETTKNDGMGLGLAICRGIMEAHGGQIWYEASEENETRFCCAFPIEVKT